MKSEGRGGSGDDDGTLVREYLSGELRCSVLHAGVLRLVNFLVPSSLYNFYCTSAGDVIGENVDVGTDG